MQETFIIGKEIFLFVMRARNVLKVSKD